MDGYHFPFMHGGKGRTVKANEFPRLPPAAADALLAMQEEMPPLTPEEIAAMEKGQVPVKVARASMKLMITAIMYSLRRLDRNVTYEMVAEHADLDTVKDAFPHIVSANPTLFPKKAEAAPAPAGEPEDPSSRASKPATA